jgi:hypothetical protein
MGFESRANDATFVDAALADGGVDGASQARDLPDPSLCATSDWTLEFGNTPDLNTGTFDPSAGCFVELSAHSFGLVTLLPSAAQPLPLTIDDWVCIDYEMVSGGQQAGSCPACDGTMWEWCVWGGPRLIFFDAIGAALRDVSAGAVVFGVGDGAEAEATQEVDLVTDQTTYTRWTCVDSGLERVFLDYDPAALPSRHRIRAPLAALAPPGVTELPTRLSVTAYTGSGVNLTVRVYDMFVGDVDGEPFCTCLGGSWNGSACAGI